MILGKKSEWHKFLKTKQLIPVTVIEADQTLLFKQKQKKKKDILPITLAFDEKEKNW